MMLGFEVTIRSAMLGQAGFVYTCAIDIGRRLQHIIAGFHIQDSLTGSDLGFRQDRDR